MMYGWWDGISAPWYGMVVGPVMMIAVVVLTVLIVAWALHAFGLGWKSDPQPGGTPLDVLKLRLARGEIDLAEFDARRKVLAGS